MAHFIGIDVSKRTLSISLQNSSKTDTITNSYKSIHEYFSALETTDHVIVYEPTWIYSSILHKYCNTHQLDHRLIHPTDAYNLSKALWCRNKTDVLDAQWLANLWGIINTQAEWWGKNKFVSPSTTENAEIKALLSQIHYLKKQRKFAKQQIEVINNNAFSIPLQLTQTTWLIEIIECNIVEAQKAIDVLIKKQNQCKQREILMSIPWIWKESATLLYSFFQDLISKWFTKDDSKKMVACAWLDPKQYQSGTSKFHTSISKQWNQSIRAALYMCSLHYLKFLKTDELNALINFSKRMKDNFSAIKRSLSAISRKLLVVAWAIFHSGIAYDFR